MIIKYRAIYILFSSIAIIASVVVLFIFGIKPGIDFTGGSILEVEYKEERPANAQISEKLKELNLGNTVIQMAGEKEVLIRMGDINEETHQEILSLLREESEVEEKRFESIGPVIGKELKDKTKIVVILSLLSMIAYIAIAFNKIKKPISSWIYGIISVFALFHDSLISLAVFSVLGYLYGVEISIPVVTAFLAVLGYSINNTVVVFDRVRENLIRQKGTFEEVVTESIKQTFVRQINTSLTTLFVAFSIFFFGGETLKYFSLVLILGIFAGTYSSIFLVGPLLVFWKGLTLRSKNV
ncbi:MAG: protein translocase subunit SecF [Candidatus Pacebacteria bacterium]|nr:protein translocase subunit SecF [Candidatus Paceibacterota bacterium]MDD4201220.1 protein translocase subunit SecF [Candidatus Paceibacterota bacterium]MDD4897443.1 protein translocase subunit SecF [Candidatus Paceibacterota bacterium]